MEKIELKNNNKKLRKPIDLQKLFRMVILKSKELLHVKGMKLDTLLEYIETDIYNEFPQ